jgi:queuine/archaeosine tRNA-ribosyltransferase
LQLSILLDSTNAEAIHSLGVLTKNTATIQKAIELGLTNSWSEEFYQKRKSKTSQ